jgi:hypothetical protein
MTHEAPPDDMDADDPIPASLTVNTRGLPPCRAALARYMAYRAQVAADIAKLEAARDKLVTELARADAAKAEAETVFEAQAASLADSLQAGIEYVCSAFTGKPAPIPDVRLAKAALVKLEAELGAKQALADRLTDRYGEHINAALREYGATFTAEYVDLVDQLRSTICKLHSLDLATGVGRVGDPLASVPGFAICGQASRPLQVGPSPEAVGAAVASWKALGKGWATDARTPAKKHLRFPVRDRPEFG